MQTHNVQFCYNIKCPKVYCTLKKKKFQYKFRFIDFLSPTRNLNNVWLSELVKPVQNWPDFKITVENGKKYSIYCALSDFEQ